MMDFSRQNIVNQEIPARQSYSFRPHSGREPGDPASAPRCGADVEPTSFCPKVKDLYPIREDEGLITFLWHLDRCEQCYKHQDKVIEERMREEWEEREREEAEDRFRADYPNAYHGVAGP